AGRGIASATNGLCGTWRGAVRLLHAGDFAHRQSFARSNAAADARPDSRSARREPLPLHRLHQDLRSRGTSRSAHLRKARRTRQGERLWLVMRPVAETVTAPAAGLRVASDCALSASPFAKSTPSPR